ncbi:hypothetical protein K474DRAFT_1680975, partial [Panus rudis PR-1116 ss-1]
EAEVDEDEDEEALDEDEEDEDVDQDNEVEEPKQEEKKVVSKKPLQKGKLQVRETPKKILKATPKKSTTPATKTVKETLKKVNHTPKQADTPATKTSKKLAALRLEASDEKEVEEEQLDPLPLIGESHGCPVTFGIPSEGRLPDEHYNNSIVLEKKVWGASGVQYVTADWEFTYKNCQLEYDAYFALDILMSHGDFNNRFDDPKMFVHLSKADPHRLAWGYLKFPAKNDVNFYLIHNRKDALGYDAVPCITFGVVHDSSLLTSVETGKVKQSTNEPLLHRYIMATPFQGEFQRMMTVIAYNLGGENDKIGFNPPVDEQNCLKFASKFTVNPVTNDGTAATPAGFKATPRKPGVTLTSAQGEDKGKAWKDRMVESINSKGALWGDTKGATAK